MVCYSWVKQYVRHLDWLALLVWWKCFSSSSLSVGFRDSWWQLKYDVYCLVALVNISVTCVLLHALFRYVWTLSWEMKRRIETIHNKSMCLLYYSVSSPVLYFIQIQMTDTGALRTVRHTSEERCDFHFQALHTFHCIVLVQDRYFKVLRFPCPFHKFLTAETYVKNNIELKVMNMRVNKCKVSKNNDKYLPLCPYETADQVKPSVIETKGLTFNVVRTLWLKWKKLCKPQPPLQCFIDWVSVGDRL